MRIVKLCILLTSALAVASCAANIKYVPVNCCPVNTCERGQTVLDLENGFDCQEFVIKACRCEK